MENEPAGWPGETRSDGVRIQETGDGCWLVWSPGSDRKPLSLCPCCKKPMQNKRAAQLVASAVYPLLAPS